MKPLVLNLSGVFFLLIRLPSMHSIISPHNGPLARAHALVKILWTQFLFDACNSINSLACFEGKSYEISLGIVTVLPFERGESCLHLICSGAKDSLISILIKFQYYKRMLLTCMALQLATIFQFPSRSSLHEGRCFPSISFLCPLHSISPHSLRLN